MKPWEKWAKGLVHNWAWKLLSIIIAFGLWLMVINIQNPDESRAYSNIVVTYLNEDAITEAGMLVRNMDSLSTTRIRVVVRAPRKTLDRLSQQRGITATVDLSQALNATDFSSVSLPVNVSLPTISGVSLELESTTPSTIGVQLEYIQYAEYQVQVTVSGTAAEGFILQEPVPSPGTVTVSGGATELEQVAYVGGEVQVSGLTEDTVFPMDIAAYNSQGEVLNNVKLSQSQVDVALSANATKELSIEVSTIGTAPDTLLLDSVIIEPSRIWVTGEPGALADLSVLQLPSIDISTATGDIAQTFFLSALLPSGVRPLDPGNNTVSVTVHMTAVTTHTYTLTEDMVQGNIVLGDELLAEPQYQSLAITVRGTEEAMSAFSISQIQASFSLTADEAGTHLVPLEIQLPEGIELVGDVVLEVIVSDTSANESAEEGLADEA